MPTTRKPRALTGEDIILGHFTLSRHHDMTQRVDAASAAGCSGIGLYIRDFQRLEAEGTGSGELIELLDERDLCLAEIEALRGWGDPDVAVTGDYLDQEATAFRMADQFESRTVAAIGPYDGTIAEAGDAFGALCDRAGEHGLLVALEFLPFTNITSASDALRIVEHADRENGGICVDLWHHQRGANDLALIRAIPGDKLVGIQVSDGPLEPTIEDYLDDCLRTRVPPGEGEMDVAGFVAAVRATGTTSPWALEVCNEAAWDTDGTAFVSACAAGLRRFLSAPPG
jgi:sugar phosphate isomerase/epimerase